MATTTGDRGQARRTPVGAETTAPRDRGGHLWPKDRFATSVDGTRVAYAVRGPEGAPPVLFCAGYLCPDNFWRDLAPSLARDHRVVILNYRGVGASSEAGGGDLPPQADGYTMELLADDVASVADAEGLRDATVIGHSMGVEVALALWRARSDLVGRLALVAGPYASPLLTFYGSKIAAAVFPLVSVTVPAFPRALTGVAMRALELPITLPVARAIRALGPHTPDEGMRTYRWHLSEVDPRTAIWTARGMHDFDPTPWLHEVDVPTVVVVGTADAWSPRSVGEDLVARLPDARLVVIEEGSHGLPIEFPDLIEPAIRRLDTAAPSIAGGGGRPLLAAQ
ncbi:MAG: alpha/beta hydrolase [Nitriliruptor sp.]|nr:MAG: alpha/beta hydrolase [Nitriliruptor sp.]